MGSTETALLWKFVAPLAAKIFFNGETTNIPIEAAEKAVAQINDIRDGLKDADKLLLEADEAQTESIINGMFDFVVGIANAPAQLIAAFLGLLGGKKGSE